MNQRKMKTSTVGTSAVQLEEAGTTESFWSVWTAFLLKHRKGAAEVLTQEVGGKQEGKPRDLPPSSWMFINRTADSIFLPPHVLIPLSPQNNKSRTAGRLHRSRE